MTRPDTSSCISPSTTLRDVTRFDGRRVLYAWPGRKHLNDVWNIAADAMEVIEWGSPSGHVEGLHRPRSLDGAEISSSSGSTTTLTERRRMK